LRVALITPLKRESFSFIEPSTFVSSV